MLAFVPLFSGIFCSGSKELKNKQKKTNKFVKYVSQQAAALNLIVQLLSTLSGWCSCPTSQVRVPNFLLACSSARRSSF